MNVERKRKQHTIKACGNTLATAINFLAGHMEQETQETHGKASEAEKRPEGQEDGDCEEEIEEDKAEPDDSNNSIQIQSQVQQVRAKRVLFVALLYLLPHLLPFPSFCSLFSSLHASCIQSQSQSSVGPRRSTPRGAVLAGNRLPADPISTESHCHHRMTEFGLASSIASAHIQRVELGVRPAGLVAVRPPFSCAHPSNSREHSFSKGTSCRRQTSC